MIHRVATTAILPWVGNARCIGASEFTRGPGRIWKLPNNPDTQTAAETALTLSLEVRATIDRTIILAEKMARQMRAEGDDPTAMWEIIRVSEEAIKRFGGPLPRDVECPRCQAKAGWGCTTVDADGQVTSWGASTHHARWKAVGVRKVTMADLDRDWKDYQRRRGII